jgi:hypothetical protein
MDILWRDGLELQYVEDQTEEICIAAVRSNPDALQFVHNQTFAVCMAAVQNYMQEGLRFVQGQTPEDYFTICKEAVACCPYNLEFVQGLSLEQYQELCMIAVERDGHILKFIKDQTPEMCKAAILSNTDPWYGSVLEHVKEQTEELCMLAVLQPGYGAIRHAKFQNLAMCLIAVRDNGYDLQHVNKEFKTHDVCMAAVQRFGWAIEFVENKTAEICEAAINQSGLALECLDATLQTFKLCESAVKQNPDALKYIINSSIRDSLSSVKNRSSIKKKKRTVA